MTQLREITFQELELDALASFKGRVAICVPESGKLDQAARRVNRLTRGAILRFVESDEFASAKDGSVTSLAFPAGLEASAVDVVRIERGASSETARHAGASLAKIAGSEPVLAAVGSVRKVLELAQGLILRGYDFDDHKSAESKPMGAATILVPNPDDVTSAFEPYFAAAEGVFFTRDLVNEPANVLTTTEFANRLSALTDLGLEVEVLEEDSLQDLGMESLLAVGRGSVTPSKMVVMRWNGGDAADRPLALVGKGVVFDTGGISLKPGAGMEEMTMDMGGAAVVAGTMMAIAKRKAAVNVVGLVGLVENMPAGNAMRPGDIVTSMKGDTIEIINTDAEGRLVLCDVMWFAQEWYNPVAMIDLATLTGAAIVALGHENAAVYSNDDALCQKVVRSANAEQEGAWRMPLGQAYDDQLKSPLADMKNIGTRAGGSITAAQFLQRFVKEDTPWVHIDIAGVALVPRELPLSPKGVSGWGVLTLNRMISTYFE